MLKDTKINFAFKKLFGRQHTSNLKKWFEEFAGRLLYVSKDEIWIDDIPSTPPNTTNETIVVYKGLELVEDITVVNHKAWVAKQGDARLHGFIPPRFGPHYSVLVYDANDNMIPSSDPSGWAFDYDNGVLWFEDDPTAHGWNIPIKIDVYRYAGAVLQAGTQNGSNESSQGSSNEPEIANCTQVQKCIFDQVYFKGRDKCLYQLYVDEEGNLVLEQLWCPAAYGYAYGYGGGLHARNMSEYMPWWEYDAGYWYYYYEWLREYYYQYGHYP